MPARSCSRISCRITLRCRTIAKLVIVAHYATGRANGNPCVHYLGADHYNNPDAGNTTEKKHAEVLQAPLKDYLRDDYLRNIRFHIYAAKFLRGGKRSTVWSLYVTFGEYSGTRFTFAPMAIIERQMHNPRSRCPPIYMLPPIPRPGANIAVRTQ